MPEHPDTTPPSALTGREALRHALTRPTRSQLGAALLLALLGFAAVTQVQSNRVNDDYEGYREQELIDLITALSGAGQRAESEIDRLEQVRIELLSETGSQQAAADQAEADLEAYSILAGVVPVQGPGLVITITVPEGQVVSAQTMLDLVQELRTAGAESMAINGQVRVVAETSLASEAGGLVIDGVLLSAPYEVSVIGDPSALSGALTFPDGPVQRLSTESGASVVFDEADTVVITVVRAP